VVKLESSFLLTAKKLFQMLRQSGARPFEFFAEHEVNGRLPRGTKVAINARR
jgi:hypothetical protein